MNNKYKKFLLMNIFSVLFVVGFVFMKPSYADSNTNLKSDNENSISSEKKLDNSDSISNENEASSDFDTISDENSDKIIEENKNLTSEETKSSSNLEENNDNIDNTNSKEVYEDRSNLKSTYKKDGNFIWTSDGRRRYVYNDGSVPEAGFIEKDNYKYFTYGDGYIYTKQFITFGPSVMYYMDDYGRMSVGKFLDNSNRLRFSNDDGNLINSKGWKINKQGKHYAYGNGYLYTNQFINFGPKVIYFMGDDGLMKTSKFNYMNIATFNPYSNGLISLSEYRLNKPHIDAMTYANSILRKVGNSLWEAYKWAGTQIKYKTITTNASLGISYFANIGFNQRSGNCYTMASAFYYLARALCYDVHQVSGYHQGYNNIMEHSWCEIRMNGKTYIYDPDVLHEFRKSVYGMAYGQRGTLKYIVSRNVYMHL